MINELRNKKNIPATYNRRTISIMNTNTNLNSKLSDCSITKGTRDNQCVICIDVKKRKRTRYKCEKCDVSICVLCYDAHRKTVLLNKNIVNLI